MAAMKWSTEQIDRVLALSTNTHGIKAVLGSTFYESEIPANACGAWLKGTWAVLHSVQDLTMLTAILCERSPRIAFLWLGAFITGAHKELLGRPSGLLGLNRIDLHAAAWTGVCHTFIQEPVTPLPEGAKWISRADECQLMFLAREPPREFLRYIRTRLLVLVAPEHMLPFYNTVDYTHMDREMDLSDRVAGNLFAWMREMDGFTLAEREIYKHEWGYNSDSDDDDGGTAPAEGDGASAAYRPGLSSPDVGRWMARSATKR
ncbi:uncharacterized protein B0I36DRAFT_364115 [Microdochium trichocladiopsis]|uniref:Uncharacterized protein n=1 Tax=Microdochium trichocladiopsis TaxID=1682393 RepID=A0A9P8Y338_9PEZI|nr:uncharacterized protein B0I36DRAFT_364115 [Microdochium trichocladiopsis]KAH7029594.1 hypothetical protein B0I36DRAFT_364115 [Microdochium trichocladiopsis]